MFGFLVVDKPAGVTSRDVVNQVQRVVRPHKVGHAGTLDPLATGLLLLAVGPATRLIDHVHDYSKRYEATFLLGRSSDTEDVEGRVVELPDAPRITRAELEQTIPRFTGGIYQIPPAYSALKVGGRRAYSLARAGQTVKLDPRFVVIHSLDLTDFEYPRLQLSIVCGSGTYVRSLGRDLARALKTEAVMSQLRRTSIGPFGLERAIPLNHAAPTPREQFAHVTREQVERYLINPLRSLVGMKQCQLTVDQLLQVRQGKRMSLGVFEDEPEIAVLDEQGQLAAILEYVEELECWHPSLVFPAPTSAT